MEVKESIKILRKELCLTQKELATTLGLSFATINRWETGRTKPDTTAIMKLQALANAMGVSEQCRKYLREALLEDHIENLKLPNSALYSVERESICQLVDDSNNAVYVSDMETNDLLYVNHRAEEYFGRKFKAGTGQKCFDFVFHNSEPCEFCPKKLMSETGFSDAHIRLESNKRNYHVQGKKINWNGKKAHVQYFSDETGVLEAPDGIKKLLDTAKVGICTGYVYDDGRVELSYLNNGYYAMIGVEREERTQYTAFSSLYGIFSEDRDMVVEQLLQASRERLDIDIVFRIVVKEGKQKWLNVKGQFRGNAEGRSIYTCVITDVDSFMSKRVD